MILFQYLFSKKEIQVLIIGLDYAGKTTLLEQMKGLFQKTDVIPLNKIPPTVGLNIGRVDVNNCRIIFWDLGGQTRLRSIWDKYYSEAHALLFVIDAADPDRFLEAKDTLGSVLPPKEPLDVDLSLLKALVYSCGLHSARGAVVEGLRKHKDLEGIPLLLFANKQDLSHAKKYDEMSQVFDVPSMTGQPVKLQLVSALTCDGIEEGISWLVEEAKKGNRFRPS